MSLCSESVDEEQVVSHIVAIQNSTNKEDPFGYLDEAEVTALSNLVKRTGSNQFIALDRQRQELKFNFPRWITYVRKNRPWNKHRPVVMNI